MRRSCFSLVSAKPVLRDESQRMTTTLSAAPLARLDKLARLSGLRASQLGGQLLAAALDAKPENPTALVLPVRFTLASPTFAT